MEKNGEKGIEKGGKKKEERGKNIFFLRKLNQKNLSLF